MKSDTYLTLVQELNEINEFFKDPTLTSDHSRLESLSKRQHQLMPIVNNINRLQNLEQNLSQSQEIIDENLDSELVIIAKEDVLSLIPQIDNLDNKIVDQLKESDPNDVRNAIIEIRAGAGGEEASLFAADIFRMYSRYAEKRDWKIEILNTNYSDTHGFKEIIAIISGDQVYGSLKFESGVHRVQRIPSTESSGRIHTSAVSVVILPKMDDLEIKIDPCELKIDVFRSSGPGGQSVNTTDSAVRITHIPTGIIVSCQDEKSQLKNKARAMSVLKSRLYQFELEKQTEKTSKQRQSSIKGGDRSAKIRTYNFQDGRVTDHRIKKTWYNLQNIMNGDLDTILSTVRDGLTKLEIDDNH